MLFGDALAYGLVVVITSSIWAVGELTNHLVMGTSISAPAFIRADDVTTCPSRLLDNLERGYEAKADPQTYASTSTATVFTPIPQRRIQSPQPNTEYGTDPDTLNYINALTQGSGYY